MMAMPNDARLDDMVEAIKTLLAAEGCVYCDEFHQACAQAYHPEGIG